MRQVTLTYTYSYGCENTFELKLSPGAASVRHGLTAAIIPMENPYCSCKLTRVLVQGAGRRLPARAVIGECLTVHAALITTTVYF